MKFKHRGQDLPTIEARQFFTCVLPLTNGVRERARGLFYVINAKGCEIKVEDGDWIIQETFGDDVRARVCKPNIFERHYEPVMTPTKELIEKLRPMWAEEPAAGFPQPTDPVDQPLTLEVLAARVMAIEERLGCSGLIHEVAPKFVYEHLADFNASEVARLKEENEKLLAEVLRLGNIIRTFNQQSVSVS